MRKVSLKDKLINAKVLEEASRNVQFIIHLPVGDVITKPKMINPIEIDNIIHNFYEDFYTIVISIDGNLVSIPNNLMINSTVTIKIIEDEKLN